MYLQILHLYYNIFYFLYMVLLITKNYLILLLPSLLSHFNSKCKMMKTISQYISLE